MMHKISLTAFIFILCFHQNSWASCSGVDNINVFEFIYQNDVIFIGKRLTKKDRKDPSVFTVIEPLKGEFSPQDKVKIERDDRFNWIGSSSIMNLNFGKYANKDMFLIYGQYDKDNTFTERRYPDCTSLPFAKTIIYFMKGPYKYRYVILVFIAFFVYLIWRVGGLKNLVTADLSAFPAIFINHESTVKTRPMRLKKTAIFVFFILSLVFLFMLYAGERVLFSYFYNGGAF